MYSGHIFEPPKVLESLSAFVLFCLAASAIYILNDIFDLEKDKAHPKKSKTRPLASGQIGVSHAGTLLAMLVIGLGAMLYFNTWAVMPLAIYVAINIAYSAGLKNVVLLDVFLVSSGFLLRVWIGALALALPLSSWMAVTTFFLALFLASIKRRQELVAHDDSVRKVLCEYKEYLSEVKEKGESPTEVVTSDMPFIFTVLVWIVYSAFVLGRKHL